MTLGVMWVRSIKKNSELVAASDSRLTGGGKRWDNAPKILAPSRGDCLLSFAGETDYAYPLMLHAQTAVDSWSESRNRRYKLEDLHGYLKRILSEAAKGISYEGVSSLSRGDPTFLLLGGYSWWAKRWRIWRLTWNPSKGSFLSKEVKSQAKGQHELLAWVGDKLAVEAGHERFNRLRSSRTDRSPEGINMEPLEVVRDVIRDDSVMSVGGPLQVAKCYQHLNNRFFLVSWTDDKHQTRRTLAGRFLLDTERDLELSEIDPDRPDVYTTTDDSSALSE